MSRALVRLEALESRQMFSGTATGDSSQDMVLQWNEIAMDVLRSDTTLPGPGWSSRALAMTSIAIFDAVNSIDRSYESYLTLARGFNSRNTSMDAAIASAAHDVLAALYPDQAAELDAALAESLAEVPDGRQENRGVRLGQITAAAILEARADDGSSDIVEYTENPDPGHWSSDPYNPGQIAWGPGWRYVTPFAIESAGQFEVPPPPALDSVEYAAAYEEVKSLGGADSTTRTEDQTEIAAFWAYDRAGIGTPPGMYAQQVAVIAEQMGNSVVENARLFALVNIAQADAGIAAWDSKYEYDLWRPVTAIQRGDEDGNAATIAEPDWEPLGAPGVDQTNFTPPFPAYVSGHATFGAAVYGVLQNFYRTDDVSFTLSSDELPGVTRSFTSFSEASAENALSRVYMGVHWRFDSTEGETLGYAIADATTADLLEPVRRRGGGTGRQTIIANIDNGRATFRPSFTLDGAGV